MVASPGHPELNVETDPITLPCSLARAGNYTRPFSSGAFCKGSFL